MASIVGPGLGYISEGLMAHDDYKDRKALEAFEIKRLARSDAQASERHKWAKEDRARLESERQRARAAGVDPVSLASMEAETKRLQLDRMRKAAKAEGVGEALDRIIRGDLRGAEKAFNSVGDDRIKAGTLTKGEGGLYSYIDAKTGKPGQINPYVWADLSGTMIEETGSGGLRVVTPGEVEQRRKKDLEKFKAKLKDKPEWAATGSAETGYYLYDKNAKEPTVRPAAGPGAPTVPGAPRYTKRQLDQLKHIEKAVSRSLGQNIVPSKENYDRSRHLTAISQAVWLAGNVKTPDDAVRRAGNIYDQLVDRAERAVNKEYDARASAIKSDESQFGADERTWKANRKRELIEQAIDSMWQGRERPPASSPAPSAAPSQGSAAPSAAPKIGERRTIPGKGVFELTENGVVKVGEAPLEGEVIPGAPAQAGAAGQTFPVAPPQPSTLQELPPPGATPPFNPVGPAQASQAPGLADLPAPATPDTPAPTPAPSTELERRVVKRTREVLESGTDEEVVALWESASRVLQQADPMGLFQALRNRYVVAAKRVAQKRRAAKAAAGDKAVTEAIERGVPGAGLADLVP